MPNQPYSEARHDVPGRTSRILVDSKALVAALVVAALLATGAAVVEAGNPRVVAFSDPDGQQYTIIDEALRNGAVPPELALAVARVAPDDRHAAGRAGYAGRFADSGYRGRRPRDVRRDVAYLERLYRRYGERWDLALSHYYGGPLATCEGDYVSHVHTASRVAEVMAWWRRYQDDPTLGELVRRTRAMQARGVRFAARGDGSDGGVRVGHGGSGGHGVTPGKKHDAHRDRPQGRLRLDRGGYVALPFAPGRFRSDNRPVYGVARTGRFD